jgi:hypothetical protein
MVSFFVTSGPERYGLEGEGEGMRVGDCCRPSAGITPGAAATWPLRVFSRMLLRSFYLETSTAMKHRAHAVEVVDGRRIRIGDILHPNPS